MPDTNTSSTKSPPVWQTRIHTSRLFATIYTGSVLLSVFALCLCPVPVIHRLLAIVVLLAGAVFNILLVQPKNEQTLQYLDNDSWQVIFNGQATTGHTASGSYRSALLTVLAIRTSNHSLKHVVIWKDAVSASDYSWLQIRLSATPQSQLH